MRSNKSVVKDGIDYRSLVGFLSEVILDAVFSDEWGEMSTSSVESRTEGVADLHQPNPALVQALLMTTI